jgi:hypothetical protein
MFARMNTSSSAPLVAVLFATSLAACGDATPVAEAPSGASGAPVSAGALPSDASDGKAHALLVAASSCWFGGLWSDAAGSTPAGRHAAGEQRCMQLVNRLYGSADKAKYDALRKVDASVVTDLHAQIGKLASGDAVDGPRKAALDKLLDAEAAAQRENNEARLAADIVKGDQKTEPESLSKDEVAAVGPLRAHAGLAALLGLDVGDLSAEAHAFGLFCAMDRLELARALPKHLKVYAVADALQLVFAVPPPAVPNDATAHLKPGTWLAYLTDVARAAGHPVPDSAQIPREREPWAWGGVIEGFADKLRADVPRLKGDVATAAGAIVARLDAEWKDIPSIAADQKTMYEREKAALEKKPAEPPKKK